MTMRAFAPCAALLMAIVIDAGIGQAQAMSIVCESQDRMTQFCPGDTSGGVSLSAQYSKASCRQGSTWGYDRRGVWVANGCRAQFDLGSYRSKHGGSSDGAAAAALAIGIIGAAAIASRHEDHNAGYRYSPPEGVNHDYGDYGAQMVTCESRGSAPEYCGANLRHARVDIDRQLSTAPCRFGDSWGWDNRGIWVSNGCRAVFSVH